MALSNAPLSSVALARRLPIEQKPYCPAALLHGLLCFITLLAVLSAPAYATVQIVSITPSLPSPQPIGTSITWKVVATDTNAGPLTFRFNMAPPGGAWALVKDFNVGVLKSGSWIAQGFVWVPTGIEGAYRIQVVSKDFKSREMASMSVSYTVNPLVTGSTPVVVPTANPLVALFSAPPCHAGSSMRVSFQQQFMLTPVTATNYQTCHPPATMTFEIAGMYPSTTYKMFAQTKTGGTMTNGPVLSFTTGPLPAGVIFPGFTMNVPAGPQTDITDSVILQNQSGFSMQDVPSAATDLVGQIIWYYYPGQAIFLTRPLQNGAMLTIESGPSWNPKSTVLQLLREIDLAGNVIKETNVGALSVQLVAMGATDAQMCNTIPRPAPVGAACLNTFHHDAIQTLPNGQTAVLVGVEKIFPPGTQGDTSGLPVDIIGDLIAVLDQNWQVIWYFDSFEHAGGAPQLDINRPAVLGESCSFPPVHGCPPLFLAGPGIAPQVKDWLHANSLYYWPQTKDIIWSSRHQDWVMKIDYNDGAGNGNILWRLGPCGDFTFNNIDNDPWPWNSHQHEAAMENNGAGPLTLFDNGNTRYATPGASSGCLQGVGSGNSRGMALTVDESTMQVTPVLSVDAGGQALADGSAQLLGDGNYAFLASSLAETFSLNSYVLEILPTPESLTGTEVLNLETWKIYRIWRMPSLYQPPLI